MTSTTTAFLESLVDFKKRLENHLNATSEEFRCLGYVNKQIEFENEKRQSTHAESGDRNGALSMHRLPWSSEEIESLERLFKQGMADEQIGNLLHGKRWAIFEKRMRLGLKHARGRKALPHDGREPVNGQ